MKSGQGHSPISRKWIDALFERFARIWPIKWAQVVDAQDYDALANEWADGIAEMEPEQIKKAIRVTRKNCVWPPSISEFLQAGRVERKPEYYRDWTRKLIAPPSADAQRNQARKYLAEIKANLMAIPTTRVSGE